MGTAYKGNRLYITVKTKILILMAIELDVFWNVLWFIEALYQASQDFTIMSNFLIGADRRRSAPIRKLDIKFRSAPIGADQRRSAPIRKLYIKF